MSISLLYRTEATLQNAGTVGKDTLAQLAVEKITGRLGLPKSDARYFQQILSAPLIDPQDISYRSQALYAFSEHPDLLDRLTDSFGRLEQLKSDFENLKKEKRQLQRSVSGEAIPEAAKNHLRVSAMLLKRCLVWSKAIREIVDSYDPNSESLTRLQEELQAVSAEGAFEELCTLCSQLEQFSEASGTALAIELNEFGLFVSAQIMDRHQILFRNPHEKRKNGGSQSKRRKRPLQQHRFRWLTIRCPQNYGQKQ